MELRETDSEKDLEVICDVCDERLIEMELNIQLPNNWWHNPDLKSFEF